MTRPKYLWRQARFCQTAWTVACVLLLLIRQREGMQQTVGISTTRLMPFPVLSSSRLGRLLDEPEH